MTNDERETYYKNDEKNFGINMMITPPASIPSSSGLAHDGACEVLRSQRWQSNCSRSLDE